MLELKTGYFAKVNKYREEGYMPIAISVSKPNWFNGNSLNIFAPEWSLVDKWKKGLITWDDYRKDYCNMLSRRNIAHTLRLLEPYKKVVLLCYEKPSDKCHRHELADYLKTKFGLDVKELEV